MFPGVATLINLCPNKQNFPTPPTPKRFEDGTVAFLDIIAINHAFDALYRITGAITDVVMHM